MHLGDLHFIIYIYPKKSGLPNMLRTTDLESCHHHIRLLSDCKFLLIYQSSYMKTKMKSKVNSGVVMY